MAKDRGICSIIAMETLESLFETLARRANARWWAGDRPAGRESHLARIIAGKIGYPTSTSDPFKNGGLLELSRPQAARTLAVAGTTSLAYGQPTPSGGWIDRAAQALDALGGDAIFLGNGLWQPTASQGWTPLTSATFDCGVIGFDRGRAFIFWVEEED